MRVLLLSLLFLLSFSAQAEDLYFTQNGAGSADGSSIGNAWSLASANTAGNWGSGAGKVSAGDTLHVSGTITNPLVIAGSGTVGNLITILFDSGAKFSKPHWNQSGVNKDSAIYATDKDYLLITGGTIESTANGTSLANQQNSVGISVWNGSHITISNVSVIDIYVRVNGAEMNYYGTGVDIFDSGTRSMNDIRVTSCTMSNAGSSIGVSFNMMTNVVIDRNVLLNNGININIGDTSAGRVLDTCLVNNNTMVMGLNWSGWGGVHKNSLHTFAANSTSRIFRHRVYNNYCSGDMGDNATSYLFLEGMVTNAYLYNNLIVLPNSNATGNGFIFLKGTMDCLVANNTIMGQANSGIGIGAGTFGVWGTGTVVKNNLMHYVGAVIYDVISSLSQCDYNVYFHPDATGWFSPGGYSWTGWQSVPYDANSYTNEPTLSVSYAPTVGDTVARGKGVNLSAYFSEDKNGVTRPASAAWTIGAFDSESGGGPSTYLGFQFGNGVKLIGPGSIRQ